MTTSDRLHIHERPAGGFSLPDAVLTVSSDIPEGMTIDEYRRSRTPAPSAGDRLRARLSFRRRP